MCENNLLYMRMSKKMQNEYKMPVKSMIFNFRTDVLRYEFYEA